MNKLTISCLLTLVVSCYCNWTLVWNDEFDQVKLNFEDKKWDIEDTGNRCNEPFNSQLNCMTALEENSMTVEGALAITAIKLDKTTQAFKKPFTSAYLYSAEYFTQGKFEVTAAMPMGKLLRAQINLYEPQEIDNTWVGIAMVDFKQINNTFEVGVWEMGGKFSHFFTCDPGVNLSDFHVYTLEREEGFLRWYFDGYNYYNYSFNSMEERLRNRSNGEMEIDINLVVGGPKISNKWSMQDILNWTCPSLIVDYVRVFQLSDEQNNDVSQLKSIEKIPESICAMVKELRFINITKTMSQSENSPMKIFYYVIPLIMILIIIIAILLWKLKHHKKEIARIDEQGKKEFEKKDENFYSAIGEGVYDDYAEFNTYEAVGDKNYEDHYLEVYDDVNGNSSDDVPRYEAMTKTSNLQNSAFHEEPGYV